MAFLEAFRRVNEECWQEILAQLKVMLAQKPDDLPRRSLVKFLAGRYHFWIPFLAQIRHFSAINLHDCS